MPYAPGISYEAPQFLAQGLNALGKGVEEYSSAAKKAKSLRSYFGEMYPDMKPKFEAMGLGELEGHGMAMVAQRQKAEELRKQQLADAQMQDMAAQAKEREAIAKWRDFQQSRAGQEADRIQKDSEAHGKMLQYLSARAGEGDRLSLKDYLDAAANTGANVDAKELLGLQRLEDHMNAANGPEGKPMGPQSWTEPTTGKTFVYLGNTLMGVNPPAAAGDGLITTDPVSGRQIFNGPRGPQVLPGKPLDDLTPFSDANGIVTEDGARKALMSGRKGVVAGQRNPRYQPTVTPGPVSTNTPTPMNKTAYGAWLLKNGYSDNQP